MKTFVSLVVALIGFSVLAQETPTAASLLPVSSGDIVRNAALASGHRGVVIYTCASMDWNYEGTANVTNVVGGNTEEVLEKLDAFKFNFRIKNLADKIQAYEYIYDDCDDLVFFGYSEFYANEKGGPTTPEFNVWIQRLALLENVEAAEILVLDESNQTVYRYNLDVNSCGQALFDPWLAGVENVILSVLRKDGTTAQYRLSKPYEYGTDEVSSSASSKIQGHYIYRNKIACPPGYTCTDIQAKMKIIEVYDRPTVYVDSAASVAMEFDVIGIVQDGNLTLERPLTVVYENEFGVAKGVSLSQSGPTTVTIPAGKWRIHFGWNKFGTPGRIYIGPTKG